MPKRKFDELISYFNQKVSDMDIDMHYKMELLGMVIALGYAHEKESEERKTGRWIPCSERLPEKPNMYTVTDSKGDVVRFVFYDTESSREYWLRCAKAWMPLPEPYQEEGEAE